MSEDGKKGLGHKRGDLKILSTYPDYYIKGFFGHFSHIFIEAEP